MTLEEVQNNALALPTNQRSLLVASLLESLDQEEGHFDEEEHVEITQEWREEIDRRIQEVRTGQVKMVPVDEFIERFNRL